MKRLSRWLAAGLLCLAAMPWVSPAQHVPSKERVDASLRRRTEIDGNNVRTSVFNFVFSGRTSGDPSAGVPYEWPKNTKRYYVALVALFVGAEVSDDTGRTVRIVDLPEYRQSPSGGNWNMNPVKGYFNVARGRIAKSDEPDTWPVFWPDKMSDPVDPGWRFEGPNNTDPDPTRPAWNGFFGKGQFSADQELYARVGDNNYDRFNYSPDTTDPTRRGLGLIIDQRVLAWSQASVADAVFFIHEVKNDGSKDIKKTAVTLWLADFVGGDGDSQDDTPDFDLILDVAFSLDADGLSSNPAFQGAYVGAAATLYLETPGNAVDRIDNDGDCPEFAMGPRVLFQTTQGAGPFGPEVPGNQLDDNGNGLIDEDSTYIPFGQQRGVGFADGIDNDGNGEAGSPLVTTAMVNQASSDPWQRWPANPESDPFMQGLIHLIQVGSEDEGAAFRDRIDNNGDCPDSLPTVTQAMIDEAAGDPFRRYRVPGTGIILYDVGSEDLGRKYLHRDNLSVAFLDEGIDEMIDESRNDGIDNDGDWDPLSDDVGLDGAPGTGDVGEGDGKPTSGVGTPFPGEPNIDKTDVSEADQIGLTNVQYLPAGAINFSTTPDIFFWASFMLPGSFVDPSLIGTGEYDLFVSSGVFPMRAGQIERISYAVVFGAAVRPGNAMVSGAKADALRKRDFAVLAYSEDYQFAQAPVEPTLTAVAGDGRVTLYWDDRAESSVDRFLAGIPGAQAMDFEGYRIYRATDAAFEDARLITDGYGSPAPFLKPIAQFDIKNGIKGFHPTPYNGVQFDLGSDNGLIHAWTDSTVQNGQRYYYAIRAYDQGYVPLSISPAESNLKISIDNVTGEVTSVGTSIAIVTPEAPVAGYLPPEVSPIQLVRGTTTGVVGYTVVDPNLVKDGHRYRITFADSVLPGSTPTAPDTFRTTSYTLADITEAAFPDTLVNQKRELADTSEQPIVDGFQLTFRNERFFGVNPERSGWSNDSIWALDFRQWKAIPFFQGLQKPADYLLTFGPVGSDTSTQFTVASGPSGTPPARPVNFRVFNTSENKQIDFAFLELDNGGGAGLFSARYDAFGRTISDIIVFLERDASDSVVITWSFRAVFDSSSRRRGPRDGDTAVVVLAKLFRSSDVFEFATSAQRVDPDRARRELDRIKVVPNPYVAAAAWEGRNPFSSGRGPRSLHFIHLPQRCTIRIFTVSGELVSTIEHESGILDGTAEWNLLTRDNLDVAYGVYIYHVDAPGLGEKVGKFAIIK